MSLAWTTLLASIFFAILLTVKRKWSELFNLSALLDIFWVAILIGTLFYGIYFFALKYTTAGNAALIALMEVFYAYLFFHVWKRDYVSKAHLIGAALMTAGALIILLHDFNFKFSIGDLMILFGVGLTPFGNYFQQKARRKVSSITVSIERSFITAILCFLIAYTLGMQLSFNVSRNALVFL